MARLIDVLAKFHPNIKHWRGGRPKPKQQFDIFWVWQPVQCASTYRVKSLETCLRQEKIKKTQNHKPNKTKQKQRNVTIRNVWNEPEEQSCWLSERRWSHWSWQASPAPAYLFNISGRLERCCRGVENSEKSALEVGGGGRQTCPANMLPTKPTRVLFLCRGVDIVVPSRLLSAHLFQYLMGNQRLMLGQKEMAAKYGRLKNGEEV